jgi:hypothetical protein
MSALEQQTAPSVIASEAKQSSPSAIERQPGVQRRHGLLRFARNDGGRSPLILALA